MESVGDIGKPVQSKNPPRFSSPRRVRFCSVFYWMTRTRMTSAMAAMVCSISLLMGAPVSMMV